MSTKHVIAAFPPVLKLIRRQLLCTSGTTEKRSLFYLEINLGYNCYNVLTLETPSMKELI